MVCPDVMGGFKRTSDGRWCHVQCTCWMPGLYVEDEETMSPICGMENVEPERFLLRCSICGLNNCGACIQCFNKQCQRAFHIGCVRLHPNDAVLTLLPDLTPAVFCNRHRNEVGEKSEWDLP